jgi:tetratricopeptide (TPR) repeat protein
LAARGRAVLLRSCTPESTQTASRFFEHALALDNGSVDAMAGLGWSLFRNVGNRWSTDPEAEERRAGALLRQACLSAPDHCQANVVLGSLLRWQGRLEEAIEVLRLATEMDPTDPMALNQLAVANMYLGRPAQALPYVERVLEIGANDPAVGEWYWVLGSCHQLLGHAREALAWSLRARARLPLTWYAPLRLAAVFGQLGELGEARRELAAARSLVHPASRGDFATLAMYRRQPSLQHPDFIAQCGPTLFAGLLKAGMPEA